MPPTGPRSPEGKRASSQNSTTHGCTSSAAIVPGENEQDWLELKQAWLDEHQPESFTFLEDVLRAAEAEWTLNRNVREYNRVVQALYTAQSDPMLWTEEQHQKLERFTRYRTTAERRFYRARTTVYQTRKDRQLAEYRQDSLELKRSQLEARSTRAAQKEKTSADPAESGMSPELRAEVARTLEILEKDEKQPNLNQGISVGRDEQGNTLTSMHPTNERLLAESKIMQPPPELVYRGIHFDYPFPPEYSWVLEEIPGDTSYRLQMLTFDQWLAALEREKLIPGGHIGPKEPQDPPQPSDGSSLSNESRVPIDS